MTVSQASLNARYIADPYPFYRRLRAQDPVHWNRVAQLWALTRYDDVVAALRHPGLSSARPRPDLDRLSPSSRQAAESVYDVLASWLLRSDPPSHTRLRGLVGPGFTSAAMESLGPRIEHEAHRLLSEVHHAGQMDVLADFAYPLSVRTILAFIGLPMQDSVRFKQWSDDVAAVADGGPQSGRAERAHSSLRAMTAYLLDFMDHRPDAPATNNDLLGWLASVTHPGDRLTDDEVIGMCALVLLAGHETVFNLIGNGLLALLLHPLQLDRLRRDPGLMSNAVDELCRYDSPLQGLLRYATEKLSVGAKTIEPGATVLLWLGAANRDPAVFAEPDELNFSRPTNRHVAFGYGVHFCLGAPLARIALPIAFRALLDHAPALRLVPEPIAWQGNLLFRRLRRLLVEL
jgi:cytochrome P450